MGYRPNVVSNIEYGNEIAGYNHSVTKFEKDLETLHIDYEGNENNQEYWIEVNSIEKLNLKEIKDEQLHYLAECLLEASDTPLAQRCGYVCIKWF